MHKNRWSHECVYYSLIRLGWVELTGQKSKWYTFKWYTNHQFSTSETVYGKQKKNKRKTGNHSLQIKWLILSSEVWISNPFFDCICCTVESVIKYVKLMWELTNWQRGVYQSYVTDSILSGMTKNKNLRHFYQESNTLYDEHKFVSKYLSFNASTAAMIKTNSSKTYYMERETTRIIQIISNNMNIIWWKRS